MTIVIPLWLVHLATGLAWAFGGFLVILGLITLYAIISWGNKWY